LLGKGLRVIKLLMIFSSLRMIYRKPNKIKDFVNKSRAYGRNFFDEWYFLAYLRELLK